MEIIGTPTIRPSLFYSDKIVGHGLGLAFLISFFPDYIHFVIYHWIILGEERYLEEVHGTVYLDYCKQVRRYF